MSMKSATSIKHFQGYEDLLKRVDDLIDQHNRYRKARLTPFLRPNEQKVIASYLGGKHEYHFDGGYPESETRRLVIGETDEEVAVCMYCDIFSRSIKIEHRDVLGAISNCGLNRDQFGDIFINNDRAVVYCTAESARFLQENLTQIHRLNVEFRKSDEHIENEVKLKESTRTVSSYRLDSIVSCLANISRAKAQSLIRSEMVSVNYETLEESDYLCDNGDTISVRGHGRYKLIEFIGKTRKDRNLIRFGKYE